jgi:GWxTD domain-containing protein
MKIKFGASLLGIFLFGLSSILHPMPNSQLPKKYETWLDEEVIYIITPKEKEVYLKLESDNERDLFMEEFWRQRDPTPNTPRNEFKDEHYRRIEYATKKFGRGTPTKGWRTDRGRFYVMLGSPYHVERFSTPDINPIEIWYYHGNPKLGQASNFRLLFFQRNGTGDFEHYSPAADGPKSLVPFNQRTHEFFNPVSDSPPPAGLEILANKLMAVLERRDVDAYFILYYNVGLDLADSSISSIPGRSGPDQIIPSTILLGEVETYPHKKVDDGYAYEFLENKAIVEVSYSVHYIGNRAKVSVLQDPSGLFFINYIIVPETLSVDLYENKYFTNLKSSIHLTDLEGNTVYQGERDVPVDLRKDELKILEKSAFHLSDSFPVVSGNYTLNLLLENMVTKEFTSFERYISVPEGDNLQMSSLILARKVDKDSVYSQSTRAFQIGNLQVYPSVTNTFMDKDTLFLFFQIHGLDQTWQEEGVLTFSFYVGERVIQTKQRSINEYQNGRDFLEEFSLQNLPPGKYTVAVSLLDQAGSKHLTEIAGLTITEKPFRGTWLVSQTNPPADDPYYSYILGNQYLNKDELEKAHDALAQAYGVAPDSLEYALGYARILASVRDFQRVREILMPFEQAGEEDFGLFFHLGRASKEVGELEEAITFYQKALSHRGNIVEILNSIGECYLKLGNQEEALRAWEASLELVPEQENIKNLVEQLKKNSSRSS